MNNSIILDPENGHLNNNIIHDPEGGHLNNSIILKTLKVVTSTIT